ncbi:MAG: deoxyribonuclease V [Pseudomonadota bacterium]
MIVRELHPWSVSSQEAVKIQERLKKRVIFGQIETNIHLLAGADVSYSKKSDRFYAGVVVLTFPELRPVEEATAVGERDFPYIPGLLSFREAPILIEAFKRIESRPDVVIFDGQGVAHSRGMGLASHMGLILNLPSVGCAKNRLFGTFGEIGSLVGDYTLLRDGETAIGAVLRTKRGTKPIFVSPGYKTDITGCINITLRTCRGYRLPEPVRQAHLLANRTRMEDL